MQPFANSISKKKNLSFYIRFFFPYYLCQPRFLGFVLAEDLSRCSMPAYCYDNSMMYVTFWDDGFDPGLVIVSVSCGALWDTLSSGRDATSG